MIMRLASTLWLRAIKYGGRCARAPYAPRKRIPARRSSPYPGSFAFYSGKDKAAIKLELDRIADCQADRAAEIPPASVRGQTIEGIFQSPEDRGGQHAGHG